MNRAAGENADTGAGGAPGSSSPTPDPAQGGGPGLSAGARGARRLGILGGSFDPPHGGHLHMARVARAARALDHVLFVPARRPPHKPGRTLAAGRERVHMLELLLAGERDVSIWSAELGRSGPSYTVDTLDELARRLGAGSGGRSAPTRLFLILGSDNLPGFPGWRRVEEILSLAEPIVIPRRGEPIDPPELRALGEELHGRIRAGVVPASFVDVSSTELRTGLGGAPRAGEAGRPLTPDPFRDLVPAALLEYLRERNLYGR